MNYIDILDQRNLQINFSDLLSTILILFLHVTSIQDRLPWLQLLHTRLASWESGRCDSVRGVSGVMACSALKQQYRDILSGHKQSDTNQTIFVYLRGTREVILERLSTRRGHFMPLSLLDSQLSDLEEPWHSCVTVDITGDIDSVVARVKEQVDLHVLH